MLNIVCFARPLWITHKTGNKNSGGHAHAASAHGRSTQQEERRKKKSTTPSCSQSTTLTDCFDEKKSPLVPKRRCSVLWYGR